MGFFAKLFGKTDAARPQSTPNEVQRQDSSSSKPTWKIWFRTKADAENCSALKSSLLNGILAVECAHGNITPADIEVILMAVAERRFRIVPNTDNDKGGVFLTFHG
ncbi:MAG: hypothetical protein ABSG23_11025 [Terriglobales bacterium]|jgi:hypothetical protein